MGNQRRQVGYLSSLWTMKARSTTSLLPSPLIPVPTTATPHFALSVAPCEIRGQFPKFPIGNRRGVLLKT